MEKHKHSYWHTIHHSRIAIFGILPPPFGGVSVHIRRVMDSLLLQQNRLFFWHTEDKWRRFLPFYIICIWWRIVMFRPKHLYYHSTYLTTSIIEIGALIFLRRILKYQLHIIDHDCRHLYRRWKLTKWFYRWMGKQIDTIVCIGQATKKSYDDHTIAALSMTVEDAFIPPILRNERLIRSTYASSLHTFIKEHTPLLLMSAAHLMRINGNDMYGVDTAITLLAKIEDEYPDAGLLIGLPQIGDEAYFNSLKKIMRTLRVSERIYILHGNKEIWPLFEQVDLFVRPTLTDGDSISVREALYFKVPVVASNVVPRPEGVHCFGSNDLDNATYVTKKVLSEYVYGPYRQRNYLHPQSFH